MHDAQPCGNASWTGELARAAKKWGAPRLIAKHDGKPTRRGGLTRRTFGELLDGVDEGYDVIAAIRRLPKQVVVQDDSNGKGKAGYLDFGLKPA